MKLSDWENIDSCPSKASILYHKSMEKLCPSGPPTRPKKWGAKAARPPVVGGPAHNRSNRQINQSRKHKRRKTVESFTP